MNIKKWASALAVFIPLMGMSYDANAAVETIEATGRYMLGDSSSENILTAKVRAREDAKRMAAEKAGVYVKSYSKVVNLALVEDEVVSISAQVMKIKEEDIRIGTTSDGLAAYVTCKIIAEVDTDNIIYAGKTDSVNKSAVTPSGKIENPKIVTINSAVSVRAQAEEEIPIKNWEFIKKPADFVGDKNTKVLKGRSVQYIPDPKHWECIGKMEIPLYKQGVKFSQYTPTIAWISPESIVKRNNRLRFQAAVYMPDRNFFRICNVLIDYNKKFQITLTNELYSPYDGRFLEEGGSTTKGVRIPFNDNTEVKTLLRYEYMKKFL